MSRTYRNFIDRSKSFEIESDKQQNVNYTDSRDGYMNKSHIVRKTKMRPYSVDKYNHKFAPEYFFCSSYRRTGNEHKEEVRNANRSRKKSMRQYLKQELQKELDNLN